jgi:hypothetical protein
MLRCQIYHKYNFEILISVSITSNIFLGYHFINNPLENVKVFIKFKCYTLFLYYWKTGNFHLFYYYDLSE